MRWLFLLLLLLNAFYYVWHQQQAPLRAKEVAPVESYAGVRQDIRLLSETEPVVRQGGPRRERSAEQLCVYLGVFDQRVAAAQLLQRLTALDLSATIESVDVSDGLEYWVYLDPMASRQATLLQLRELQARRIDSYLIGEGDLVNGISLGIYPREAAAQELMVRVRGLGYDAKVRPLPRTHQRYWVKIDEQSTRLADTALLTPLLRQFSDVKQQQMPCQGIALP